MCLYVCLTRRLTHSYLCLFTLPLWSHTWGAADWVSLTSRLFFTNSLPSSQSAFLSSSVSSLPLSLPLCSLFCEPERGGWLGFSPLQTGLCMPVSLPVAQTVAGSGCSEPAPFSPGQRRQSVSNLPGSWLFLTVFYVIFYIILKRVGSVIPLFMSESGQLRYRCTQTLSGLFITGYDLWPHELHCSTWPYNPACGSPIERNYL